MEQLQMCNLGNFSKILCCFELEKFLCEWFKILPLFDTVLTSIIYFTICNNPKELLYGLFPFIRWRSCVIKRLSSLSEATRPIKVEIRSHRLSVYIMQHIMTNLEKEKVTTSSLNVPHTIYIYFTC